GQAASINASFAITAPGRSTNFSNRAIARRPSARGSLYGALMSSRNLLSSLLIPIERLRGKVPHCRVVLLVQQFRGEPRDEPEHSFAWQTCMRSIRQNREP